MLQVNLKVYIVCIMKPLRPYQRQGIEDVIEKFQQGDKRVVYQLPTGGGKTLTISALIHRFHQKYPTKDVLFFVHRLELLEQFTRTYENQYKDAEIGIIDAKSKAKRFDLNLNVCMIETAVNRLKKNSNWFGSNVGLIIFDEAHTSSFDKLFQFFPNTLTVGLTATPVRMGNALPMNEFYGDIVSNIDIVDLIEHGSLAPNKTYVIDQGVNYSKIKKVGGEFKTSSIFDEYSKAKHITNVVKVYEQYCKGQKTIIFNASVEHSELVNRAFVMAGYNSRHLDGATNKIERKEILDWFARTPDAVLHNVGVLNAGFDEPSILNVIFNHPTTSLALWLQSCGRGSRVYDNKEYFKILDLGGNAERLGDWSASVNWVDVFRNGKVNEKGDGIAPVKTCPSCYYLMPIQQMICPDCGHVFAVAGIEEEVEDVKLKLFASTVNVHKISRFVNKRGWKPMSGLFQIVNFFANSENTTNLDPLFESKVIEWARINGIEADENLLKYAKTKLNEKRTYISTAILGSQTPT